MFLQVIRQLIKSQAWKLHGLEQCPTTLAITAVVKISLTMTHEQNLSGSAWRSGHQKFHHYCLEELDTSATVFTENGLKKTYIIMLLPCWFNGLKQSQSNSFSLRHLGPKVGVWIAAYHSKAWKTSSVCKEATISKHRYQSYKKAQTQLKNHGLTKK